MRKLPHIIGLLLFLGAAAYADDDHREARRLAAEGEIQPLVSILERIQAQQPGSILEVELERKKGRMIYEIEILDQQGTVWELKVDAVTGEILKHKVED